MQNEIVKVSVPVRKKNYDVVIKNVALDECTVEFDYNKKHFVVNEIIPNEKDKKMLTIALRSLIKAEIYRYNLKRKTSKAARSIRKKLNIPVYTMPEE